jgi:Integrase core domain
LLVAAPRTRVVVRQNLIEVHESSGNTISSWTSTTPRCPTPRSAARLSAAINPSAQQIQTFSEPAALAYLARGKRSATVTTLLQVLRDLVLAFVAPRAVLVAENLLLRQQAPRSAQANSFAERVIGTIRRDCFDHVIVRDRRHAERAVGQYVAYSDGRPHRSFRMQPPDRARHLAPPRPLLGTQIVATPTLGGLHYRYGFIAVPDPLSTRAAHAA